MKYTKSNSSHNGIFVNIKYISVFSGALIAVAILNNTDAFAQSPQPVTIEAGTVVCNAPEALANRLTGGRLMMGGCYEIPSAMRVNFYGETTIGYPGEYHKISKICGDNDVCAWAPSSSLSR